MGRYLRAPHVVEAEVASQANPPPAPAACPSQPKTVRVRNPWALAFRERAEADGERRVEEEEEYDDDEDEWDDVVGRPPTPAQPPRPNGEEDDENDFEFDSKSHRIFF